MDNADAPVAHIVAGPNGAGKTTFATVFLPNFADCREFLNADLIAAGLAPFSPETQNVRAGRLMLERIHELVQAKANLGFETTLSGRTYARLLDKMRSEYGYCIYLYFLWLPSADLAVARVANRVRQGGHNIPEADIRRRFAAGLRNLFKLYLPLADGWWLYDASQMPPAAVFQEMHNQQKVIDPELYARIVASVES